MGGGAATLRLGVRRGLVTLAIAAALALTLAMGAVASASALTMTSSPGGTTTGNTTPSFAGTTEDLVDPVSVQIFKGPGAEGKAVRTLTTSTPLGSSEWSLTVQEPLADDEYTALAEQTEVGGLGQRNTAGPVTFTIDTKRPQVVLDPLALSNNTHPSFSGTANESKPVTVTVYSGSTAGGTPLTSVEAPVSGGTFKTPPVGATLLEGQYTAVASEPSSIPDVKAGESEPVTFEVHTKPPSVSLEPVTARSNVTEPKLSGTASDSKPVTVHVWEGGSEVAKASSPVSGGAWSATVHLSHGQHSYTAYATEPSSVNGLEEEGRSQTIAFEVDTEPPVVSLSQLTPNPSNVRNPSFSGSASEAGPVTVRVFEGEHEYASVTGTASNGSWSTPALGTALPQGEHTFTAVADEPSTLSGNGEGESHRISFTVDTEPPKLTLAPVPTPSNQTKRFFSGTDGGAASSTKPIVVHVFEGPTAEGNEVAKVTTSGTQGAWSSGSVTLATGEHTYTAVATQESPVGNDPGRSQPQTFVVDTEAPKLTLAPVATPTNNNAPSFEGTDGGASSETKPIVVRVFEGTRPEGNEVAKTTTPGTQGAWKSPAVKLPKGGEHTYTAIATQQSPLGNEAARSSPQTFVVDDESPHLTLNEVHTPSNNTAPVFSGSDGGAASETKSIVVHVYEGPKPEGNEVTKVTVQGVQGTWTAPPVQLEKGTHTYTAVATQESPVGNAPGKSGAVTFVVNTEPPLVTLKQIAEISNNQNPQFSGTASEAGVVTVALYSGSTASGTPLHTLKAQVSNGRWFSSPVTQPLPEGEYTAVASEPSGLGNAEGASPAIRFVVNLRAPTVVVTPPAARSRNTEPSFAGSVSEPGEVTVEVFEGPNTAGKLVQTATANASGHSWSAGPVQLEKGHHTYTVVAAEKTSIGKGTSAPATFEVDTEPPAVTLSQPPALSNHATPSFSGASDETSAVTVEVFAGPKAEGSPVSSALADVVPSGTGSGGNWTSENAAPALADGTYTAVAFQKSAIGNPEGRSAPVTFAVDTAPPTVTLKPVPSPSSIRTPSFAGTASDHEPVTVTVYPGPKPEGTPAATVSAESGGGEWVSPKTETLPWGEYTAVATEPSSLGNTEGFSKPVTFTVAQIPPIVVGEAPASIKRSSAVFYASVDPNGGAVAEAGCRFEYGTTSAYGQSVGCAAVSGAFPLTGAASQVFARANELSPSTSYHFRIVAVDEGGVAYGPDESFTTAAAVSFNEGNAPEEGASASVSSHGAVGVASFFASQLAPPRHGTLAWLLKWGVYGMRLKAPGPGTAVVDWFYLPPGASLTKKTKHHPVLVAAGRRTFGGAQTLTIKLHLTAQGRRLLKRSRHIRLTATCTFTPSGHAATSALARFELRR